MSDNMFGQVFQSTDASVKFMLSSLNMILLFSRVPSDSLANHNK